MSVLRTSVCGHLTSSHLTNDLTLAQLLIIYRNKNERMVVSVIRSSQYKCHFFSNPMDCMYNAILLAKCGTTCASFYLPMYSYSVCDFREVLALMSAMQFGSSKKNIAADTALLFPHINMCLLTTLKQRKPQVEQLLFYLCRCPVVGINISFMWSAVAQW